MELFCESCPKACENFLALCASDYYNGSLFHRNIKGFIVQTGDPTGTGKGGSSIWGQKFEDEFKEQLKVSELGAVSQNWLVISSMTFEVLFLWLIMVQTLMVVSFLLPMLHNHIWISNTQCLESESCFLLGKLDILWYFQYCRVIDGFETLDELERLPVSPKNFRPLSDVRINSITIHANPLAG